jgi:thymidine phosphorylase
MHIETSEPQDLPPAPVTNQTPSRLALRRVAIDTWRENVAYLHRDCAVYRAEGFQALSKIEVRANGRRILATVNVVDDPPSSLQRAGAVEDAFAQLGVEAATRWRWRRPSRPNPWARCSARSPASA